MTPIAKDIIQKQLASYQDPYLEKDLVAAKAIKKIQLFGRKVVVDVVFGYPIQDIRPKIVQNLIKLLTAIRDIDEAEVNVSWKVVPHVFQPGLNPIKNVKNIIAMSSGKGGVGKSTTAVNIAADLLYQGARVGILDADIYGPNLPHLLGSTDKRIIQAPENGDQSIEPILLHGLQTMSIGYLIDVTTPMVWRGPLVSKALQQLLYQTQWDNVDYLVVDMPPGTGDIQLTLAKSVPVSGAVVITTPQEMSLLDARKGLEMFKKVNVPILGIIENMSTHVCTECGHEESIFGTGGGEQIAKEYGMPLLGQLPLDKAVRVDADRGIPTVLAKPDSSAGVIYQEIARAMAATLSLKAINYASKFPGIVVE